MKEPRKHLLIFFLMSAAVVSRAQTKDSLNIALQQMVTLKQDVDKLKRQPGNDALREKIIKKVLSMKVKPPAPMEVDILKSKAVYAFQNSRSQDDYKDAVRAYKETSNLAPWLGDLYFNLALAQELAGQPADAIKSYKFYLMATPNAEDGEGVIKKIGELQYVAEKQGASFRSSYGAMFYG